MCFSIRTFHWRLQCCQQPYETLYHWSELIALKNIWSYFPSSHFLFFTSVLLLLACLLDRHKLHNCAFLERDLWVFRWCTLKGLFGKINIKKFISFLFLKCVTRAFIVKRAFKAFEKMRQSRWMMTGSKWFVVHWDREMGVTYSMKGYGSWRSMQGVGAQN